MRLVVASTTWILLLPSIYETFVASIGCCQCVEPLLLQLVASTLRGTCFATALYKIHALYYVTSAKSIASRQV